MHVLPPTPISTLKLPIHDCSLQTCSGRPESKAHGSCFKATFRGRYASVAIHKRAHEGFAVGFEMDYEWNLHRAVVNGSVPSSIRRLRPSASHGQRKHRKYI